MRRKDIIIVSVLINAGLLVALFSSGLKTKKEESTEQEAYVTHKIEPSMEKEQFSPQVEVESPTTMIASPKAESRRELAYDFNQEVKRSPVQPDGSYTVIQVKKGDMLEKIARIHNTSVEEIIELNNLSTTRLNIGQVLRIPHAKTIGGSAAVEEEEYYYIVKSGDNPWTIASKNNIKVEELLRLNQLTEEKARRLRPGDKLRIR